MTVAANAAPPTHRFALADIAPVHWKNGGGITREIAVWPPGAGMDDFAWRVSVADIAADGPFSAFPGVDRQIALLSGAGVRLRAADGSFDHALVRVGEPFAFPGETGVQATLVDGVTRDFNVMTRRGRCRARIDVRRAAFALDEGTHPVLLLAVAGQWHAVAGDGVAEAMPPGAGRLYADGAPAGRIDFRPAAGEALCLQLTLEMETGR